MIVLAHAENSLRLEAAFEDEKRTLPYTLPDNTLPDSQLRLGFNKIGAAGAAELAKAVAANSTLKYVRAHWLVEGLAVA